MELPSFLALSGSNVQGSLPLVLGVTGHRDIRPQDVPKLEALLRDVIQQFRKNYPSTPLVMLSSLADGADRLGARVALECGLELITPLPMPVEIYETDFTDEESLKEFRYLRARASHSFVVPYADGLDADRLDEREQKRLQYGQVGGYIARYSQVLIALWNGVQLDKPGGTSSVVRYKLEGNAELEEADLSGAVQNPLDPPESGPVYHIVTRRASVDDIVGEEFSTKIYFPLGYDSDEQARNLHNRIYAQIEQFNRDAGQFDGRLTKKREQSRKYLLPDEEFFTLTPALRSTIDNFTLADTLASHFQKYTHIAFRGLFCLVLFAAAFFDVYAHMYPDVKEILVGYFIALCGAFIVYDFARRRRYQSKYLDYRALAEGLRVQFYWQYAGIRNSASEFYMRKQKSELDWIRFALRTLAISADHESSPESSDSNEGKLHRLVSTQKHWVEDQAKYYKKALHRDHKRLHVMEIIINLVFIMGVEFAALQLFILPNHGLIVMIGLAPILAALIGTYIEKDGLVGHIKQYERMSSLFARANTFISNLLKEGKQLTASQYLFELGREALAENGDWLLHHRERPLEVPKG